MSRYNGKCQIVNKTEVNKFSVLDFRLDVEKIINKALSCCNNVIGNINSSIGKEFIYVYSYVNVEIKCSLVDSTTDQILTSIYNSVKNFISKIGSISIQGYEYDSIVNNLNLNNNGFVKIYFKRVLDSNNVDTPHIQKSVNKDNNCNR